MTELLPQQKLAQALMQIERDFTRLANQAEDEVSQSLYDKAAGDRERLTSEAWAQYLLDVGITHKW